jgi:amidase
VVRTQWAWHVGALLKGYDALALPTAQLFAFSVETHWPREINGTAMDSYHRWMQIVTPGTMSGHPVISIPAGTDAEGRAMGVQLIGQARGDVALLGLAAGI